MHVRAVGHAVLICSIALPVASQAQTQKDFALVAKELAPIICAKVVAKFGKQQLVLAVFPFMGADRGCTTLLHEPSSSLQSELIVNLMSVGGGNYIVLDKANLKKECDKVDVKLTRLAASDLKNIADILKKIGADAAVVGSITVHSAAPGSMDKTVKITILSKIVYKDGTADQLPVESRAEARPSPHTATQPVDAGDVPNTDEQLKAIQKQLEALDTSVRKHVGDIAVNTARIDRRFASDDKRINKLIEGQKVLAVTLEDSKSKLGMLQGTLNTVGKNLKYLQDEVDALKMRPTPDIAASSTDRFVLEELKTRILQLERAQASVYRVAPTPTATIILINAHTDAARFTLNQKTFHLPAGSTRVLENQPVGSLQYQVDSHVHGPLRTSTTQLGPNGILRLTVR